MPGPNGLNIPACGVTPEEERELARQYEQRLANRREDAERERARLEQARRDREEAERKRLEEEEARRWQAEFDRETELLLARQRVQAELEAEAEKVKRDKLAKDREKKRRLQENQDRYAKSMSGRVS